MRRDLRAPFPWFGNKRKVTQLIWEKLGSVPNYIEPFFGSGAILFGRPYLPPGTETVSDADGLLSNFWRAVSKDPDAVAEHADWPIIETDLHARHLWLVGNRDELTSRLEADPEFYDAKAAGWWVWGCSQWIGSGWCSGEGPWVERDGVLVKRSELPLEEQGIGVGRQVPDLGSGGKGVHRDMGGVKRQVPALSTTQGINRQVPHLKDGAQGVHRQMPHLGGGSREKPAKDVGLGVHRKMPDVSTAGKGTHREAFADEALRNLGLRQYMRDLQVRLRRTRVVCGDWKRITGPAVTTCHGVTGVVLDPPYADAEHTIEYAGGGQVWDEVVRWCLENGNDPLLRIVLCGYDTGKVDLPGWHVHRWKTGGGYGNQGEGRGRENAGRETLWFSPACLTMQKGLAFDEEG